MGIVRVKRYLYCKKKKKVRTIKGVWKGTSCRHIFKDYNKLTVASLCIIEVICYIKKYKDLLEQNAQIPNARIKLDFHLKYEIILFRKRVVNVGIRLHSKVLDHINNWANVNPFKEN